MNPIEAMKLYGLWRKFQAITKEKASMKIKVPQFLTAFGSLATIIGLPTLVGNFVHTHPMVYMSIAAAAVVLHSVLPSIFAAPSDADLKATGLKTLGVIALLALVSSAACAQTAPAPAAPAPIANIYAAGVSYNVGGSPAVAGTGLYARLVNDGSGTYAFTVVDALPNTLKPFTVTTNIGVGIAQKVTTWAGVPIYVPAATGISWSGSNTGWQWNTGGLAAIHVKGQYYVMPSLRVLKSSVSNGSGYQPVFGVLFAWGK